MNELVRNPDRRSLFGLFNSLDDVFDDFWRPVATGDVRGVGALAPAVDVSENDNEYRVRADLPGVSKDDLDISIQNGILTINAETKSESEQKEKGRVIRQERRYGKFVRSLRVGDGVDTEKVTAELKDGVLHLVLPKAEQVKPKRIEVAIN